MSITLTEMRQALADMAKLALASKNCRHAYAYTPRSVPPGKLPVVVVDALEAEYQQPGTGSLREVRQFRVVVYVAVATHGAEGSAEQECDGYLTLLQDYFAARDRVLINSNPKKVLTLGTTGDEGLLTISSGDDPRIVFIGVGMRITASHTRPLTLVLP